MEYESFFEAAGRIIALVILAIIVLVVWRAAVGVVGGILAALGRIA